MSLPLLKQKVLQLDVLSGMASTGHWLQGQTKEALIVVGWTYMIENWIYVVLSRVTTMKGIFFATNRCGKGETSKSKITLA